MKIISTKAHGVLDYLVGILLIASPWLFNFAQGGPETTVPVVLGITTIIYSLLTNYEYSIANVIPFSAHLVLDTLSAIFLGLSPWLLGFADTVMLPHVIFGILELGAVLMTQRPLAVTARRQHA
jgi:hypothetical protein